MQTLKFKDKPKNAFFATVNQLFGGASQFPTIVKRAVIKSLSTVQTTKQCPTVVGSLNFRVRMLLRGALKSCVLLSEQNDRGARIRADS